MEQELEALSSPLDRRERPQRAQLCVSLGIVDFQGEP